MTHHLPTVVACLVFAGVFLRYRQNYFLPGYSGYLLTLHAQIVEGTASAPDQYRPMMPWAAALLSTVLTLPHAVLVLDGVLLVVAVGALHLLLRRRGVEWVLLPAALGFAYWSVNTENWHPELFLLLALVSVGSLLLLEHRPRAWAVPLVGALMLGARTDYCATFGAALVAVGCSRRSPREVVLGAALGVAAVATTCLWIVVFPRAHYVTGVLQVGFNLLPHSWFVLATYVAPVLITPVVLMVRLRRLPPLWPVLAWFAAQFAVTFVVGRVEETRIFLPFAAVLSVVAVVAFQELHREDLHREDLHREDAAAPAR